MMLKIAIETDDQVIEERLLAVFRNLDGGVAAPVNGVAVEDEAVPATRKVTKKKRGRPPKNPEPEVDEDLDAAQSVLEQAAAEVVEGEVETKAEQAEEITRDLLMGIGKTFLDEHGAAALKEVLAQFDAAKLSEVDEKRWPELWQTFSDGLKK